jgi:cardiolipin synthase
MLLLLTIAAIVLLALVYFNLSVNARSSREDDVVSAPSAGSDADALMRSIGAAGGQAATAGNRIDLYQNGDEIFPPMFAAIAAARSSVHFVTFVYEAGEIPTQFAAAFTAAARRGVQVRVVLDRNGAKKTPAALINEMRSAGCAVRWFGTARWYDWQRYNRRTHRKLLVVDGEVAFIGGVGIADQWSGAGQDPHHWRDTHTRVQGPAVAGLQTMFVDSWNDTTGELAIGESTLPSLSECGATRVCVVQSNPANATSTAQRSFAALIASANRSLFITNAYFVPPPPFAKALCEARRRGVDVQIVVPGPFHNKPLVRWASRHTWPGLVGAGVQIYEHQRTMVHVKVAVVDGVLASFGSVNFDPRSFALNAEGGIIVYDAELATAATTQFAADRAASRQVTPEDLRRRSFVSRAADGLAYWFRAQL